MYTESLYLGLLGFLIVVNHVTGFLSQLLANGPIVLFSNPSSSTPIKHAWALRVEGNSMGFMSVLMAFLLPICALAMLKALVGLPTVLAIIFLITLYVNYIANLFNIKFILPITSHISWIIVLILYLDLFTIFI
jgi:hypothetical protein